MRISPIKENENGGFQYSVSDEQSEIRSKMTDKEILNWVGETAKFIYEAQTPEERERMRKVKGVKW